MVLILKDADWRHSVIFGDWSTVARCADRHLLASFQRWHVGTGLQLSWTFLNFPELSQYPWMFVQTSKLQGLHLSSLIDAGVIHWVSALLCELYIRTLQMCNALYIHTWCIIGCQTASDVFIKIKFLPISIYVMQLVILYLIVLSLCSVVGERLERKTPQVYRIQRCLTHSWVFIWVHWGC